MPLSSSTLIHFTADKKALLNILSDNFHVFNCRENFTLNDGPITFVVPMVSFCDIPLSEVKSHIEKYGSYGIGLTKEWGVKNGLNPVLYIAQKSSLAKSFQAALVHFADRKGENDWTTEQKSLVDVLRYMKNYEGDLTRKGTTVERYRFSDEREWRYVPPAETDCHMICLQSEYEDSDFKDCVDAQLVSLRLSFEPNDIKYIIIRDDSEIGEFVEHLRRAKGKRYVHDDVERLTTRILTSEQINNDM